VRIRGKLHDLWRAVDQHGNVLDVLVQSHRNTKAAKRFFRRLLKGLCYVPRAIVTNKLGSYSAAKREILPALNIGRAGTSTIGVRCRTNPPGGANTT
jgi:putative transposase